MISTENKFIMAGAVVAAVVLLVLANKAGEVAAKALDAINPLNNENIFNEGFTSVYESIGENNTTLGSDVYDLWHPPERPTNEQIKEMPMGASTSLEIYQWITGSKGNQITDFKDFFGIK